MTEQSGAAETAAPRPQHNHGTKWPGCPACDDTPRDPLAAQPLTEEEEREARHAAFTAGYDITAPTRLIRRLLATVDAERMVRDAALDATRPSGDAEQTLIKAANAPSLTGDGLAVPHYRDTEAIWKAIEPFTRPSGDEALRAAPCSYRANAVPCRCGFRADEHAPALTTPSSAPDVEAD